MIWWCSNFLLGGEDTTVSGFSSLPLPTYFQYALHPQPQQMGTFCRGKEECWRFKLGACRLTVGVEWVRLVWSFFQVASSLRAQRIHYCKTSALSGKYLKPVFSLQHAKMFLISGYLHACTLVASCNCSFPGSNSLWKTGWTLQHVPWQANSRFTKLLLNVPPKRELLGQPASWVFTKLCSLRLTSWLELPKEWLSTWND